MGRDDGGDPVEHPDAGHHRQEDEPEPEEDEDLLVEDVDRQHTHGVVHLHITGGAERPERKMETVRTLNWQTSGLAN